MVADGDVIEISSPQKGSPEARADFEISPKRSWGSAQCEELPGKISKLSPLASSIGCGSDIGFPK